MNIIFSNYDSLDNPYYAGGGAYAIHSTAKRLAKNHSVTVLAGSFPGSQDEVRDGVHYKRIGFSVGHPQVDQALYQLALPWHVLTHSYDVWIESFTPPFSTAFLPWLTRKPVIGVTHLLGGKEMSKKYHLPFHFVESFGLRQYKHLITLSEFLASQIRESGTKANIEIIANGLDNEILDRTFEKSEEHILFLGRLDIFHKGLDILLKAYAKIADQIPYKLLLAGSGVARETETIKRLIKQLGIEGKVELLGKVGDIQKWRLFEKSIFTIIPSRVEGFAIVALEAMASKSPLIISNIQGLQWIPETAAVRVASFSPEDFAQAMKELIDNPEKRKSMSQSGHETAKQYTWDNVASKYEQLIEKVTK